MRLVLVDWLDSYGCSPQWREVEKCNTEALRCSSVGWLVRDGANSKVIVPHISDPNHPDAPHQGCGDMTIPTKAIIRIYNLTDPRKPARR
jgi:hypothetical protein